MTASGGAKAKKKTTGTPDMAMPSPAIYEGIGYDELLVYSVFTLEARAEDITFERIVAECYGLFPARFHLRGYAHWPDSARVNKSWLRCRSDKGLLVGRVKQGFRLTPKGREVAGQVEAQLRGIRPQRRRRTTLTDASTKEGSLMSQLEGSAAFQAFAKAGDVDAVSEFDFRDALVCTMDTPSSVLNANLMQFEDAARMSEAERVLEFLRLCRARFGGVLQPHDKRYKGGMMRRKSQRKAAE